VLKGDIENELEEWARSLSIQWLALDLKEYKLHTLLNNRFINPCFAKALANPRPEGNPRKARA
jgi:hypothetical protein